MSARCAMVTLWSPGRSARSRTRQAMFDYTVGRRPALGRAAASLGRAREPGPRRGAARLAACSTTADYTRLRARPPRARSSAIDDGELTRHRRGTRTCTPRSRSGSPGGCPASGERLHTGRSRNDQVACDLRLFLKDYAADAARRRAGRWPRRCSASHGGTARCSGRATHTSGARCRRRSDSGRARMPKGCSTRPRRWRASGRWWTARRSAARPDTACRCRSGARSWRARSGSPGSTATWRRCRVAAASSRRRRSSGAPSSATSSPGCRRT